MQPYSFALAEDLDWHLGDPHDASGPFSFARCLALDDRETFPDAACRALEDWGIQEYYVPGAHGGALAHYEDVLQLMRMIARRDLTVAIGHGKTYLGAACAWVGATPDQASVLGARVRDRAVVSLGLTERAHGSDLIASDFVAHGNQDGFQLSGEKWLINNATRSELLCLLAATSADRGPRSLSLFLLDKRAVSGDTVRCLPKVRTHGIRGADISGIALHGTLVPVTALIGEQGAGLEILLKALQITRTMCTSLSLGAGDTALRLVSNFSLERKLYGRALVEVPQARRVLAEAFADLLTAEVIALSAARGIDTLPAEASVSAAVAKYLVPTSMDATIGRLGSLLGARAFLKDVYAGGLFQKVERDHRIVGLFDGNTLVNLQTLITNGRALSRGYARNRATAADLGQMFALDRDPGTLDPAKLRLTPARAAACSTRSRTRLSSLLPSQAEPPERSALSGSHAGFSASLGECTPSSPCSPHAWTASNPRTSRRQGSMRSASRRRARSCFTCTTVTVRYPVRQRPCGRTRSGCGPLWAGCCAACKVTMRLPPLRSTRWSSRCWRRLVPGPCTRSFPCN